MGRAQDKNPHNITSTWPKEDPKGWTYHQRLIDRLQIYPIFPGKPLPVFSKTDPVPVMAMWTQHVFIILTLAWPILLHQAWVSLTGHNLGKLAVFGLYTGAYVVNAVHEVKMLRRLVYAFGCFDGDKHERDGIPNGEGAKMVVGTMNKTGGFRLAMATWITYQASISPLSVMSDWTWWSGLLVRLSLYGIFIDLFFYTYHRACHEVPILWKYHRTHHLIKHPTAAHSGFADDEQEIIEMVIVPWLAFAVFWTIGLPLDFFQWWVCFEYVTFTEIAGHSGLRVQSEVPSPVTWLLKLCDAELVGEDHDLHHRQGWKKSFNYGKQTRVWDRLFGSSRERMETKATNLDPSTRVKFPLF